MQHERNILPETAPFRESFPSMGWLYSKYVHMKATSTAYTSTPTVIEQLTRCGELSQEDHRERPRFRFPAFEC